MSAVQRMCQLAALWLLAAALMVGPFLLMGWVEGL